jgi:hypothetical protein
MTHFEDLTPYTYMHPEEEAPQTVNIGWLDRWHSFPVGETSEAFRIRLQQLCLDRMKRTRGFHSCDFCRGRNKPGSSAEIRVPGRKRIYAAPELVYHYVAAHNYLPPGEFIDAVLQSHEPAKVEE